MGQNELKGRHTPGPWKAIPEPLFNGMHVAGRGPCIRAGHLCIAKVDRISASGRKRCEEGEANARLIAAAPELLAFTEKIRSMAEWGATLKRSELDEATALISLATGGVA